MAVRTFDGVDDRITFALGSTGFAFGAGTCAVIVRRGRDATSEIFMRAGASSTSTARYGLETNLAATVPNLRCGNSLVAAASITVAVADGWVLLAATKATGTATPRFHKYSFASATWTHEDAGSTLGNSTAPTSGPTLGAASNGSGPYQGDIAAAGIANTVLSDVALEAAVVSEAAWIAAFNVSAWVLDQGSTATTVVDDVGTSDQSAITGTAVLSDGLPWLGPVPPPLVMAPRISM